MKLCKYPFCLKFPPPVLASIGRCCRGGWHRARLQMSLRFIPRMRVNWNSSAEKSSHFSRLFVHVVSTSARARGHLFCPLGYHPTLSSAVTLRLFQLRPFDSCPGVSRACAPFCSFCCVWGPFSLPGTPRSSGASSGVSHLAGVPLVAWLESGVWNGAAEMSQVHGLASSLPDQCFRKAGRWTECLCPHKSHALTS